MAMAALSAPLFDPVGWRARLSVFARAEPLYFGLAVLLVVAMAPTLVALALDDRLFEGSPVWLKPLKFEIALAIYLFTLVFYARWLPHGTTERTAYRLHSTLVAAAIVLEMLWIGGAAMLATASHFNPTPLGQLLYPVMGIAAVLLTSASTVMGFLIAGNSRSGLDPATKEGVVIGLLLTLPLTMLTAGTMASFGSHAVGGASADDGVALFGWLRSAGDLRVGHFFATHAMHVLPLIGLALAWTFPGRARTAVRFAAGAYVAFVVWTFAEALAGRAFLPGFG